MRVLVLCSLIVMGGCASSPVPPTGADAAAAAPPPAAQPSAEVSKAPFDLPPGFKPTRISGELFYCRKMVVLGSRFPKQLCLNEDQLKEHMAGNEAMKRNKEEVSRLCTTKEGCSFE